MFLQRCWILIECFFVYASDGNLSRIYLSPVIWCAMHVCIHARAYINHDGLSIARFVMHAVSTLNCRFRERWYFVAIREIAFFLLHLHLRAAAAAAVQPFFPNGKCFSSFRFTISRLFFFFGFDANFSHPVHSNNSFASSISRLFFNYILQIEQPTTTKNERSALPSPLQYIYAQLIYIVRFTFIDSTTI